MTRSHMPALTVAPNGARHGKADHPALPVRLPELVRTACACAEAGADAIHIHLRDAAGRHLLDAGLYHEAIEAIDRATGGAILVQATTETAGRYNMADQVALLRDLRAPAVSIALREFAPDAASEAAAAATYADLVRRGVLVQHILYCPSELDRLGDLVRRGVVPDENLDLLFVLGRYGFDRTDPADLVAFLGRLQADSLWDRAEWSVCAFGRMETRALTAGMALGGKARVGFENSFLGADGRRARDNAERVAALVAIRERLGFGRKKSICLIQ